MNYKFLFFFVIIFFTAQCKHDEIPQTEIELFFAQKYQAEKAIFKHVDNRTTTDGVSTYENYIVLELYDPKQIEDIMFNERILKSKCKEISDFIMDSVNLPVLNNCNELRVKIIDRKGFFIFKTEESSEFKYDLRYLLNKIKKQ